METIWDFFYNVDHHWRNGWKYIGSSLFATVLSGTILIVIGILIGFFGTYFFGIDFVNLEYTTTSDIPSLFRILDGVLLLVFSPIIFSICFGWLNQYCKVKK